MITAFTGSHLSIPVDCLLRILRILQYFNYFPLLIIINLDEGSIFNKGQGKKLSDMGPPYLCNNSNI